MKYDINFLSLPEIILTDIVSAGIMTTWLREHDSPGRFGYSILGMSMIWYLEREDDALLFRLKFNECLL